MSAVDMGDVDPVEENTKISIRAHIIGKTKKNSIWKYIFRRMCSI